MLDLKYTLASSLQWIPERNTPQQRRMRPRRDKIGKIVIQQAQSAIKTLRNHKLVDFA
jgi:hypothetical protein